jgi:foldase protein PrsA
MQNSLDNTVEQTEKAIAIIEKKKKSNSKMVGLATFIGLLAVAGAYLYKNGYIVAATVNGESISRIAVIHELETASGKAALEALIQKKLIESELKKSNVEFDLGEVDDRVLEIKTEVEAQGATFDEALSAQGMTLDLLKEQIETQIKLEKVLADKITVTDDEVATFIKEAKLTATKDSSIEAVEAGVRDQLSQQKFQTEAGAWLSSITENASINYLKKY